MADLSAIRAGIATRLATISGLRTEDFIDGTIEPPVAVVGWPEEIDYDSTFGRGIDVLTMPVRVFVASADNRNASNLLEAYLNKTGSSSVKTAIEADRTLGGVVSDCYVQRMTGVVWTTLGQIEYLAADWQLLILD